ncbi:MAG: type II CAAX endopeptidase family protein [bacterium]|nr:type II CAAX endopeptidase family protein [bacterium]
MDEPQISPEQEPVEDPKPHRLFPPPNEAFLVLFTAVAATLSIGVLLAKLGNEGIFLSEALFIIPPLIYLKLRKYPIKRCFRWNAISPLTLISTILIGLSLVVLLDEADRLLNMFFPMPQELQQSLNDFLNLQTLKDYLLVGFGVVLAASICEESLFRGFLQLSLEAHGRVNRAVLFGALLFALAHFNPWWMVQILILGVFLGFISWRADSTIPGMVIHGMNNTLALFSGGIEPKSQINWYTWGDHVSPAILIGAAALLFIGLKLFLRTTEMTFSSIAEAHDTSTS